MQIEKHFTSSSNNLTLPFNILQSGYVNSMAFAKSGKFLIAGVGQVFDLLLSSVFLCSLFFVLCLNANLKPLSVDMAGNEIWKMGMLKVCAERRRYTSLKAVIRIWEGLLQLEVM